MKFKATLIVCLLSLIAAGWLLVTGVRTTPAADTPRLPTAEVGRYQVLIDKNGFLQHLLDTATGQVWKTSETGDQWVESIASPKKK
jgi:hypothetical protein